MEPFSAGTSRHVNIGDGVARKLDTPYEFANAHVDAAVDGLRKAGQMDHLPRSLLTRAWVRFVCGDAAGSRADLDEAWDIAERGPMPLYQADIHLTRARLFHRVRPYPWQDPCADLAEARRLIDKHGYHRRDGELADAEAAIRP